MKKLNVRPLHLVQVLVISLVITCALEAAAVAQNELKPAPLDEVRLLDGPFKVAQDRDLAYILKLDPDRLLAPFRREAGLPKKAESYGNWESEGLDGHTAGHYLSALSFMYASTGNPALLIRLKYMVGELAECQKANGNGYVGGVPGSKDYWPRIAAGNVGAIWDKWVPWYNLHKTFAGLRDAWLICGNEQAKEVLIGLSDWCANTVSKLSDDQMQQMLGSEFGGMNEVLADVSSITGDKKYLDLAIRFDHQAILGPLAAHQDHLDGLHANTQIPKVIGFERIGVLSGNQSMQDAANFFWQTVTQHRSVAIGGNSTKEHFNPVKNFTDMLENREGPETCNSYNMLKLTQALFDSHPQADYFDFAERVLYNHILTTIDDHGFVYFTPMRPGHYRTYSTFDQSFWCCVGTGMENHGKYGGFIYAEAANSLYVNLFIPSEFNWKEQGMTIRQETKFPDEAKSHFVISGDKSSDFALNLRHPSWVKKGAFTILVNGVAQSDNSDPSSYVSIKRTWQNGDTVDIALPMNLSFERFPDGMDDVAFLYGPLVLAASIGTDDMPDLIAGDGRWDHVAGRGELIPLDKVPSLVCPNDAISQSLVPVPNEPLTFTFNNPIFPDKYQKLKLVPFYHLPDTRYVIYWQHFTPEQYQGQLAKIHEQEAVAVAMDNATVDRVSPGEQQPEVDHHFQGVDTETGYFKDRHWRDAKGWFSYDLKTPSKEPLILGVTYWGGDTNHRFSILLNGQKLTDVDLENEKPDNFVTVRYPIPPEILAGVTHGTITVKFVGSFGTSAGGVFDVRLIKASVLSLN